MLGKPHLLIRYALEPSQHSDVPVIPRSTLPEATETAHGLVGPVGPDGLLRDADVIAPHTGALGDCQPALRVDPPSRESRANLMFDPSRCRFESPIRMNT